MTVWGWVRVGLGVGLGVAAAIFAYRRRSAGPPQYAPSGFAGDTSQATASSNPKTATDSGTFSPPVCGEAERLLFYGAASKSVDMTGDVYVNNEYICRDTNYVVRGR